MPSKEELKASLEKMVRKIDLPKNKKRFESYNKTLQFDFEDDGSASCHIVFKGGTVTIIDGIDENAELIITTSTETIIAIIEGNLSPTRAFMAGKIKTKGPMPDLMKLQVLMK